MMTETHEIRGTDYPYSIISQAKRLYDLGWAVHWIKPGSKAPVKAGWSGPTRDDWKMLKAEFRHGYGLGVRLGAPSRLPTYGYLANIDVDIKSSDPRHRSEALEFVEKKYPGILVRAPQIITGYGLRLVCITAEPVKSGKLGASSEECSVKLPTTEINRRQLKAVEEGRLTKAQLAEGYRIRPAWEVEFMSEGRQVVLPPSIHPETGVAYLWSGSPDLVNLPLVEASTAVQTPVSRTVGPKYAPNFTPVKVDLSRLENETRGLLDGIGVTDRSAACFSVAIAMIRRGYSDDEIITVLTDKDTFLGETAYDHRSTSSRAAAAAWVRDYCLKKARAEYSAEAVFWADVTEAPLIASGGSGGDTKVNAATESDWRAGLQRTKAGAPAASLLNLILVLENAVGPAVFKRDLSAGRDYYGTDAPWTGGEKGKALTDDDAVNIKAWVSANYRFEPSTGTVFDAMTAIATKNSTHPVRAELEALPPWDGVSRLDTWLAKNFEARGPAEYLAQVFRKWLVASVTRTYEPGAKFDWMPILEGAQGTGKSSFGAVLFGQRYFTDWLPNLADKDAALQLQGKRCAEFGELDSLRRNEIETIKAFVTRQVDNVRPPYGRKSIEIYRQTVFFGTTNRETYLRDDTGNRRFNPVEVGRLNFSALERDRDQLWAEALFIYRNGLEEALYLDNGAEAHAVEIQKEKIVLDESAFMVEALREFIEAEKLKPENERFDFFKFKLVGLFRGVGPLARFQENGRNIQFAIKALKVIMGTHRKVKGETWWKIPLAPPHTPPTPTPVED